MTTRSRLFAAVAVTLVSACQDSMTAPSNDDPGSARSATKAATDVRVVPVQYGTDGTVTYSVRVRSTSRTLSAFQGDIWFAPGTLEIQSQTATPVSGAATTLNAADVRNGRLRFSSYTQASFNASGEGTEVFRFVARPIGTGESGVMGALEVVGLAPTPATSAGAFGGSAAGGECSATELWGDGNADGQVTISDAQQVARYSVGLSVGNLTAMTARGDVTADGDVNVVDAQQIARFSVGLSAAPRTSTPICQ